MWFNKEKRKLYRHDFS